MRSLPNWTEFNDCFTGTKIRISDVDGIVERNGDFLVLDVKRPGTPLNTGQRYLYTRLAELQTFTVLIVYAENENDVPSERLRSGAEAMIAQIGKTVVQSIAQVQPDGTYSIQPASNSDLWQRINKWFLAADMKPRHRKMVAVPINRPPQLADAIRQHMTPGQIRALIRDLESDA
jgi:hypothetical protein